MAITRSVRHFLALFTQGSRAGKLLVVAGVATLATLMLPTTPAWALLNPLILSQVSSYEDVSPFTKWTSVLPRYEAQRAEAAERCIGPDCLNHRWEAMLRSVRNKSTLHKVEAVNRFINRIPYVTDQENFDLEDVWQTPYEMMANGGDCEDYVIAKYISLKRLGVPESLMRILVVRDQNLDGQVHAALEVMVDGRAMLLDNQIAAVTSTQMVFHYEPIFALSESKWWSYN